MSQEYETRGMEDEARTRDALQREKERVAHLMAAWDNWDQHDLNMLQGLRGVVLGCCLLFGAIFLGWAAGAFFDRGHNGPAYLGWMVFWGATSLACFIGSEYLRKACRDLGEHLARFKGKWNA